MLGVVESALQKLDQKRRDARKPEEAKRYADKMQKMRRLKRQLTSLSESEKDMAAALYNTVSEDRIDQGSNPIRDIEVGEQIQVVVLDEHHRWTDHWVKGFVERIYSDGRIDLLDSSGVPIVPALPTGIRRKHLRKEKGNLLGKLVDKSARMVGMTIDRFTAALSWEDLCKVSPAAHC